MNFQFFTSIDDERIENIQELQWKICKSYSEKYARVSMKNKIKSFSEK